MTATLFGSSGFPVGTYNILYSTLWGTSPPDPLGFIALEARAAPSKDSGDDRFGRIVPCCPATAEALGRFPPEPYPPQRQGYCSPSCPRPQGDKSWGFGGKAPKLSVPGRRWAYSTG